MYSRQQRFVPRHMVCSQEFCQATVREKHLPYTAETLCTAPIKAMYGNCMYYTIVRKILPTYYLSWDEHVLTTVHTPAPSWSTNPKLANKTEFSFDTIFSIWHLKVSHIIKVFKPVFAPRSRIQSAKLFMHTNKK